MANQAAIAERFSAPRSRMTMGAVAANFGVRCDAIEIFAGCGIQAAWAEKPPAPGKNNPNNY
jgi:hypothetical protein